MPHGISVRNSRKSLAASTECSAGHDGYVVFVEESGAEVLAGQPKLADLGEDVEGSLRLEAGKADVPQSLDDELAAAEMTEPT